jgi:hypothetical protein
MWRDNGGEEDFVDVLLSLQKGKQIDFVMTNENMKAIVIVSQIKLHSNVS